jgi:hypothetical protein
MRRINASFVIAYALYEGDKCKALAKNALQHSKGTGKNCVLAKKLGH